MYRQVPFARWLPKPLSILLTIIVLFPIMTISGVYTGNAAELSGALAAYTEFVSLANNAVAIGMAMGLLVVLRVRMRFKSQEILIFCSIILAALSYMNATTDNPYIIVAGSFLIGFFKLFPMIDMITAFMVTLSPNGDRGRFYALFYPMTLCIGQLSTYIFASAISDSTYQAPYFIMGSIMLLITIISIIFQHTSRFSFKKPLYQIDWLSMVSITISTMSFNVFFTFMKQQGWFISPYIIASLFVGLLFLGLTIYRQKFIKRKLFNFSIFYKSSNLSHSVILLLFLGLYMSSSSLYTQFSTAVLGHNNLVASRINLWMIPGLMIAGVYAYYSFKNKWKIKYYIITGFVCFFLHTLSLYLLIQPQIDIEYIEYAMIVKGLAMGILYIGIWFYASSSLAFEDFFSTLSILLLIRSFLGTAIGGSILSWAGYQFQWQSLSDISNHFDSGQFQNAMDMYPGINLNALLASIKIVLGYLCWLIVPILLFVLFHHYGEFNYRRVVLFRKVLRGNSFRGYRL